MAVDLCIDEKDEEPKSEAQSVMGAKVLGEGRGAGWVGTERWATRAYVRTAE